VCVCVQKGSIVSDWVRVCIYHAVYRLCPSSRSFCHSNMHTSMKESSEFWLWVKKEKSNESWAINLSLVPLSSIGIFAIYWLIAVLKNYAFFSTATLPFSCLWQSRYPLGSSNNPVKHTVFLLMSAVPHLSIGRVSRQKNDNRHYTVLGLVTLWTVTVARQTVIKCWNNPRGVAVQFATWWH
jgi:hypothetical protein